MNIKKLFKNVAKWYRKWIVPFLPYALGVTVIILGIILKRKIKLPSRENNFVAIPGKEDKIMFFDDDGGHVEIQLPENVKAKDVAKAVKATTTGKIFVETKHEKVDRHNSDSIDDNSLDQLGL